MDLHAGSPDDRVMVFIDMRNITKSIQMDSAFSKMDFVRLTETLVDGRRLTRAYVFDGQRYNGEDVEWDRFHARLRYSGFTVDAEYPQPAEGRGQKGVDVRLACKALMHALHDDYDVAIVVSGDGDFVPLLEEVKNAGKRVEVAAYWEHTSARMVMTADVYHKLDSIPLLEMRNPDPEEESDDEEPGFEDSEVESDPVGEDSHVVAADDPQAEPDWEVLP